MTHVLTCLLSVSPLDSPLRTALWIAHWGIPDIQRSTPRHECSINICGMNTWLTVILHGLSSLDSSASNAARPCKPDPLVFLSWKPPTPQVCKPVHPGHLPAPSHQHLPLISGSQPPTTSGHPHHPRSRPSTGSAPSPRAPVTASQGRSPSHRTPASSLQHS